MRAAVTQKHAAVPAKRLRRRNYITFPTELRKAIPDLPTYIGRTLELASVEGDASNTALFGSRVHLAMGVQESGKLKGRYSVRIDLQIEAARALAAHLMDLAGRADKLPEAPLAKVTVVKRKAK